MLCPHCHADRPAGSPHCSQCGKALTSTRPIGTSEPQAARDSSGSGPGDLTQAYDATVIRPPEATGGPGLALGQVFAGRYPDGRVSRDGWLCVARASARETCRPTQRSLCARADSVRDGDGPDALLRDLGARAYVPTPSEIPKDPRSIVPDLPEFFSHVVSKCLERDPKDRYQTAREVLADLDRQQVTRQTRRGASLAVGTPHNEPP
jgi:hypothetical protein